MVENQYWSPETFSNSRGIPIYSIFWRESTNKERKCHSLCPLFLLCFLRGIVSNRRDHRGVTRNTEDGTRGITDIGGNQDLGLGWCCCFNSSTPSFPRTNSSSSAQTSNTVCSPPFTILQHSGRLTKSGSSNKSTPSSTARG